MNNVMYLLQKLSSSFEETKVTLEAFETFSLRFALKLLKCPYLDKRILGINEIRDFVLAAMKKEQVSRPIQYFTYMAGVIPAESSQASEVTRYCCIFQIT
jgi:hypothetical protein